jgi:hypothetical protein
MTKHNTSGMKDIFEEAKQDVLARIDARIAELQSQIFFLENGENQYDAGRGDVEDRNEIIAMRNEIRTLESDRAKAIAELSTKDR